MWIVKFRTRDGEVYEDYFSATSEQDIRQLLEAIGATIICDRYEIGIFPEGELFSEEVNK